MGRDRVAEIVIEVGGASNAAALRAHDRHVNHAINSDCFQEG